MCVFIRLQAERGFSFMKNGPLDMRFGRTLGDSSGTGGRSAADIVNCCPAEELEHIFREYGEERYARSLAARIVEARSSREESGRRLLSSHVSLGRLRLPLAILGYA